MKVLSVNVGQNIGEGLLCAAHLSVAEVRLEEFLQTFPNLFWLQYIFFIELILGEKFLQVAKQTNVSLLENLKDSLVQLLFLSLSLKCDYLHLVEA